MKSSLLPLAALALLVAWAPRPAQGAEATPTRYTAKPGSKIKIDGTSTIHDWTVETKLIGGFLEVGPNFPLDPAKKPAPGKVDAKAETFVMVNSIKSGKKSMDDVMYETMKQPTHPKISFRLLEMALKETPPPSGPLVFDTKGAITVSGVTVTNAMIVTLDPKPNDQILIKGETALKMTQFGMSPPAPAIGLGLIKTGDEVKVSFEWVTAKAP